MLHQINYNTRLQPTAIELGTNTDDPASKLNLAYSYGTTNNNGNIASVKITVETTEVWNQTFTYDALNRLDIAKEVKDGTQQWQQNNDYDRYGNRCLRSSTATTACVPQIKPAQNNRLNAYGYDVAGNQISDAAHTYAYDAENHIKSVDGEAAYVYDGEGKRVRKLLGENLRFVYGITGELLAEFDGTDGTLKKEYIYGVSGLVATIEPGAGPRYVTADTLGTARILTVWNGAVVSRHDHQPFGEELFEGMGGRTSSQGFSNQNDNLRQKFTGKERNDEAGLDYFGARYYSGMASRFTSLIPVILLYGTWLILRSLIATPTLSIIH